MSTKFVEKSYYYNPDAPELLIRDSKGITRGGDYWRVIGLFGETAKYRVSNQATAQLLDRLIDNACLKTQ